MTSDLSEAGKTETVMPFSIDFTPSDELRLSVIRVVLKCIIFYKLIFHNY